MDENWQRIIHSEMLAMSNGKLLGFQLWVNMPAKLKKNKPEYIYIKSNELGVHEDNEKTVKVIAGKYEKTEGPEKITMLIRLFSYSFKRRKRIYL